jgi:DNA-binding NarL/FixJ family response regulator
MSTTKISVFLADDHVVMLDGLGFLLEAQADIDVVGFASDGRDAVRQVKQLRPDVVIMDIAMPELNGLEATEQILSACPSSRVIILSMHSTAEHIYRALQAGARGYLLKASAGAEVVKAVREVYNGRRYLSQRIEETIIERYIRKHKAISPLESLSPREREILQLIVEGRSSAEIGKVLYISPRTVETYRKNLMQKLGVSDLTGLIKFAIRHGLTPLD